MNKNKANQILRKYQGDCNPEKDYTKDLNYLTPVWNRTNSDIHFESEGTSWRCVVYNTKAYNSGIYATPQTAAAIAAAKMIEGRGL